MVAHDDEGEQLPAGADDGALQVVEEPATVAVVEDDVLAGVAARHDVVDGAFEFDAESSGHGSKLTEPGSEGEGITKNKV